MLIQYTHPVTGEYLDYAWESETHALKEQQFVEYVMGFPCRIATHSPVFITDKDDMSYDGEKIAA